MFPALASLTGGGGLSASSSATATTGDARGGTTSGSGISSPIVIGGFKSDGTSSGNINPLYIAGAVILALIAYRYLRK